MTASLQKSDDKPKQCVEKQAQYSANKGPYSQGYGLSSGHITVLRAIKKAECWRRLLRVPWTAKRSNQSILREINPEYSLEGLKLKCQYFGHLIQTDDSLEKCLMLGKIEGRRIRGC